MVYSLFKNLFYLLSFLFFRITVYGAENLPKNCKGFIIASNHFSHLDPILIGISIKNPCHFMARKSLFKGVFGKLLLKLNAFPVNRYSPDRKALKEATRLLSYGHCLVVFPEGTRQQKFYPGKSNKGACYLGFKTKKPIVPTCVIGTLQALPRGRRWIKPANIKIIFGKPRMVIDDKDLQGEAISILKEIYHLPKHYPNIRY